MSLFGPVKVLDVGWGTESRKGGVNSAAAAAKPITFLDPIYLPPPSPGHPIPSSPNSIPQAFGSCNVQGFYIITCTARFLGYRQVVSACRMLVPLAC